MKKFKIKHESESLLESYGVTKEDINVFIDFFGSKMGGEYKDGNRSHMGQTVLDFIEEREKEGKPYIGILLYAFTTGVEAKMEMGELIRNLDSHFVDPTIRKEKSNEVH